jgi:hypothetical protein
VDRAPEGPGWLHEVKLDGYRIEAVVGGGKATLWTRNRNDWTSRFPETAASLARLGDCIVDGELCALDDEGNPDLALLASAMERKATHTLVYFTFDLLAVGYEDLRDLPLTERKARLKELLPKAPAARIRFEWALRSLKHVRRSALLNCWTEGRSMRRRSILASCSAFYSRAAAAQQRGPDVPPSENVMVDVSLVLATDVSSSIDDDEAFLQREGYRAALTDPAVLNLVAAGPHAAIGVAYVEWSGLAYQRLLLPWTRIASAADALAWAAALARQPLVPLGSRRGTSISRGIAFSLSILGDAPWKATRQVIDICGDGANNNGGSVEAMRDAAVAKGVTLNGMVIEGGDPNETGVAPPATLEDYDRNSVIGGPGAFVLAVAGFDEFAGAIRRKLVRELASSYTPAGAYV